MKVWLQIMESYGEAHLDTMAEIKKLTKSPPLGRHILGFEKKDSASGVFLYHRPGC